jgi:hypothetical protein
VPKWETDEASWKVRKINITLLGGRKFDYSWQFQKRGGVQSVSRNSVHGVETHRHEHRHEIGPGGKSHTVTHVAGINDTTKFHHEHEIEGRGAHGTGATRVKWHNEQSSFHLNPNADDKELLKLANCAPECKCALRSMRVRKNSVFCPASCECDIQHKVSGDYRKEYCPYLDVKRLGACGDECDQEGDACGGFRIDVEQKACLLLSPADATCAKSDCYYFKKLNAAGERIRCLEDIGKDKARLDKKLKKEEAAKLTWTCPGDPRCSPEQVD